jgi:hypothetical protein
LYARALRRQAQAQRVLGAVTGGVFLGLLDREHRARVDQNYYDGASELIEGVERAYTDEEMVRSGLFDWEQRTIEEHFPPGAAVAVVGAGAGREVLALLEAGYDARGYEPHPGLARRGAELLENAGHPGRLHGSQRDTFPGGGPLDAAVVGWGAYGLIGGRATRVDLLRGARARLSPGDPLLVSYMPRPPASRYLDVVHRIASPIRRLRRAEPPEIGDCLLPNFVHYFTEAEIRAELEAAGFAPAFLAAHPYGHALARAI